MMEFFTEGEGEVSKQECNTKEKLCVTKVFWMYKGSPLNFCKNGAPVSFHFSVSSPSRLLLSVLLF